MYAVKQSGLAAFLFVILAVPAWANPDWQQEQASQWVIQGSANPYTQAYTDELTQIYFANLYQPLWQETDVRLELEEQLKVLMLAGISPDFEERYLGLQQLSLSSDWRHYDLLATDTLLAYLSYIQGVPQFGRQWYFGTNVSASLSPPSVEAIEKLLWAVKTQQLLPYLISLRPTNPQYNQMASALTDLEQMQDLYWPGFYQKGLIRLGSKLNKPDSLITLLERWGDISEGLASELREANITTLTPELEAAVKSFQQRHGLKVDGIIGPKTRYWLAMPLRDRIRVLALNMERLRLWPAQQGNLIVVNIPNFQLNLWLENEHILDSKVIVGRPSRRTPLMTSRVDTVIFNPSWNVPAKIMREDILPKLRTDSGYLARNNFAVLPNWQSKKAIPHDTINWEYVNPNTFPYRLRQQPGDKNALGRVKFNIPNRNAIFMHDTPAKSLFDKSQRTFSSGCIRVEQADELAQILLTYSGLSQQKFDDLQAMEKTKYVGLKSRVKVHTIYQTAWVDEAGEINFRNDVYRYDRRRHSAQNPKKFTLLYPR